MFRIYVGLAVFGMALYLTQGVIGFMIPGDPSLLGNHILIGVFSGIYLCGLHTLTMFHLIGTAKDMKEAARILPEYAEIVSVIRASKMRIFPMMTLAILVTIATVVLGGGIHTKVIPLWVHDVMVGATFLLNLYTFWIAYFGVKQNLLLLTLVDYKVEQMTGKGEPTNG